MRIISLFIFIVLLLTSCQNKSVQQIPQENNNNTDSLALVRLNEQIKVLSKKIEKKKAKAPDYIERAHLYQKKDKILLAIRDAEKAAELDPDNKDYLKYLASLYFDVSNAEAAIKTYKKYAALDPDDDFPYIEMGRIYLYQAKPKECIENLNMALRINQYNAETYALKASYYLQMRDTARCISNLVTSINMDEDYFNSYLDLGYLYNLKKMPEAIPYYTNALRLQPHNEKALYGRGVAWLQMDSFSRAEEDFKTLLTYYPDNHSAAYQLGYLNFLRGRFEEAIQFFSTVCRNEPANKLANYGVALCYDSLGNRELALEYYQNVLELDPDDEDVIAAIKKLN